MNKLIYGDNLEELAKKNLLQSAIPGNPAINPIRLLVSYGVSNGVKFTKVVLKKGG